MPDLSASAALVVCEQSLRRLITEVGHKQRPDWLNVWTSEAQRNRWAERFEAERAGRGTKGVSGVSISPLDYAHFYELVKILDKQWQHVAVALGEKRVTYSLLLRFEGLRDAVAHSRDVVPFEQDLLSGIAGEIRNRVAIYLSEVDNAGTVYPVINSVQDNFGNIFTPNGRGTVITSAPITLHPGDRLLLELTGTDPQNRALVWTASANGRTLETVTTSGPAQLGWDVVEVDVGDNSRLEVRMHAQGGRYKRLNATSDGMMTIFYVVRPPLDDNQSASRPSM